MVKGGDRKAAIVESAVKLVEGGGTGAFTIQAVAADAGTAKGLVHYHFGSKEQLLAAAVGQIAASREARWRDAFGATSVRTAIGRTWRVIEGPEEQSAIRTLGCVGLDDDLVGRTVNQATVSFSRFLADSVADLLDRLGRRSRVPIVQLGWMLAAVAHGAAVQLAAGADRDLVHDAYAAAWLGILSLAE